MAATLKPTKAARAAAPDLFGQPAYYNEANHHAALIEQLKSLSLMPAAWALEDLLARVDTFDTLTEELESTQETVEDQAKEVEALEAERDILKAFFDTVVRAFEEAPFGGFWPAAEPDDSNLVQAIIDTLQREPANPEG
jgi:hypothetical protein